MVFEVRDNTLLDWVLAVGNFCSWSIEALVHKAAWNFHRQKVVRVSEPTGKKKSHMKKHD